MGRSDHETDRDLAAAAPRHARRPGGLTTPLDPELDCAETTLDRASALRHTLALMETLPYHAPSTSRRPAVDAQWTDEDGDYRRERRYMDAIPDVETCRMTERHIEPGDEVCVFGDFSAAKGGIVPDPHDWSKIVRIMKGNPESIVRQLKASIVRRTIGGLVAAGLAAAAIAAFVANIT